jgi:hypothetical protein
MPFLPRHFVIPEPPGTDEFMLTPLRVDHLVLDFEAVMSSRERLWQLFGPGWGWPQADMTMMQDLAASASSSTARTMCMACSTGRPCSCSTAGRAA